MADLTAFLSARIATTQALIVAYEAAILALTTTPVVSYTLDTGQGRQTVTRQNIDAMQATLEGLYNLLTTLNARLCGGTITVRPDW